MTLICIRTEFELCVTIVKLLDMYTLNNNQLDNQLEKIFYIFLLNLFCGAICFDGGNNLVNYMHKKWLRATL